KSELARSQLPLLLSLIKTLYGDAIFKINLHTFFYHFMDCIENHGPLFGWNCFIMEEMNGLTVKYLHSNKLFCGSVMSALQALQQFKQISLESDDSFLSKLLLNSTSFFHSNTIEIDAYTHYIGVGFGMKLQRSLENLLLLQHPICKNYTQMK